MNQDLISRLRHHAEVGMFVTDSCAKLLREAADALASPSYVEGDGWIQVKDRVPENTQTMLVYDCYDGRCLGYYVQDISGWVKSVDGDRLYEVTHWMPLPASPTCEVENK